MIHSYMTLHILYVLSLDGVTFVLSCGAILFLAEQTKKKKKTKKKVIYFGSL